MKHYFQAAIITCPECHVSSLLYRHCGPTVMRNMVYHGYYPGLQFGPYRMTFTVLQMPINQPEWRLMFFTNGNQNPKLLTSSFPFLLYSSTLTNESITPRITLVTFTLASPRRSWWIPSKSKLTKFSFNGSTMFFFQICNPTMRIRM